MALLECKDCQGKVSDAAMTCPHCGRPMKPLPAQVKLPHAPTTLIPASARGAVCPVCGTHTLPPGRGMHGGNEQVTCIILILCGLIPGVIYYAVVDSKPYCPKCKRRV